MAVTAFLALQALILVSLGPTVHSFTPHHEILLPRTASRGRRTCGGIPYSQDDCHYYLPAISISLNARAPSKWDTILDYNDDDDDGDNDEDDGKNNRSKIPVPPDMKYEPGNVQRQHHNFLDIRNVGGKDVCNDIYVRNPDQDVCWYVGKVARVSDVSLDDCIARQWNMIETHATNLRPIELFPHRGRLQVWSAPGDSELEVAYNRPTLQLMQHTPKALTSKDVKTNAVGFQGEIYQKGEEGFRTWRTNEGWPARPEINPGGETRPPTAEEMAQIQKNLQGKDINEVYEEQERRKEQGRL